jgi:ferredoxin
MVAFSLLTDIFKDSGVEIGTENRRCLRNRLHSCRCNLCIDACPTEALQYSDNRLELDRSRCSSCMRCTAVCPNDVFTSNYDFPKELSGAIQTRNKRLIFSCPHQQQFADQEIVVPCLGVFSMEALLLLGTTAKKEIHFNASTCDTCTNAPAFLQFNEDLDSLTRLAGSLLPAALTVQTNPRRESETSERRSFLGALKKSACIAARASLLQKTAPKPVSATARRIPAKTALRQQSLADNGTAPSLVDIFTPQLAINHNCVPCPRCSGICPTGALRLKKERGRKTLQFTGTDCSSCGLCLSFCTHSALSLSSSYGEESELIIS